MCQKVYNATKPCPPYWVADAFYFELTSKCLLMDIGQHMGGERGCYRAHLSVTYKKLLQCLLQLMQTHACDVHEDIWAKQLVVQMWGASGTRPACSVHHRQLPISGSTKGWTTSVLMPGTIWTIWVQKGQGHTTYISPVKPIDFKEEGSGYGWNTWQSSNLQKHVLHNITCLSKEREKESSATNYIHE